MGLLPLALLLWRPHAVPPPRPATAISIRLLPLLPPPAPPRAAVPTRPRVARAITRHSAEPISAALTAPVGASSATLPATEPVAIASAASSPASAPLNLSVSKAMLAGTRSEVGKMADASGAYTGDGPRTLDHKLAQGVAGSAKMDCLGPNGAGSLLSVVVIAVQAARGKCAGQ